MPELPEVETVRRGLGKLITGKKILAVERRTDKSLPVAKADIDRFVVGSTILEVRRRAKMLIVDLSSEYSLLIHLKMTGQIVFRGEENWGAGHPNDSFLGQLPDRSTRVIFTLSDGNTLFFNDQRKFGWIKLYPTMSINDLPEITKLGPEPLIGDPTEEFIRRIRRHPRIAVKAAILDQTTIAGVGNIYADESLWRAQIHPQTKVSQLEDDDLKKLLTCIQEVMNTSITAGGSTARNYVKADGSKGDYLDKFAAVYNRTNSPCFRCGREIIKTKVAGRGTHYCPYCQQLK